MKSFLAFGVLVSAFTLTVIANAAGAMSPSTIGVGPHGYDFLLGNWSCKNSIPSPIGGPAATSLAVTKSANGSIAFHATGAAFDGYGFIAYEAKTKTWYNPFTLGDGSASTESSRQTGVKTVWTGLFYMPGASKPTPIRDTYTMASMTRYVDVTEAQGSGGWKAVAHTTCTKS